LTKENFRSGGVKMAYLRFDERDVEYVAKRLNLDFDKAREMLDIVEDFSEPEWRKTEILKILVGVPTKWEDFVDEEMWGIEVEGHEEDLLWINWNKKIGILMTDRYNWWDIVPREVGSVIYTFPDKSLLMVFDENLYKIDHIGNIFWIVERYRGDKFIGERGYSTFEKAKQEALKE
jgi:hypothetical protein